MEKMSTKDNKFQKAGFYFLPLTSYFLLLRRKGQVMLEFAFCMIILFLMMYGIIMVFRWVGLDLGQRQQAHEAVLTAGIDTAYGSCALWTCASYDDSGSCVAWAAPCLLDDRPVERGPLSQIDPYFYTPSAMNAVWAGD